MGNLFKGFLASFITPLTKLNLFKSKELFKIKTVLKLFNFVLIFLFIAININPKQIYAAEKFITDYQVTYTVAEDGKTRAEMKITLTNASSEYYYASSYKVELGFENLENITARDVGGIVTPEIEKTNNGYAIKVEFSEKVVGVGNKQILTLTFDTPDIAQKEGKIWEINIPGIDDEKTFNSFVVDLKVPPSFGKPAYIKPAQKDSSLRFTKDQLTKSGISIAFGTEQQYSYTLLYHLQNKNLFPIKTEIAIPADTNYQQVYIESIIPEPVQVKKDSDGNWLAQFELKPTEEIDVTVKGKVNISLYPKKQPLTEKELAVYLEDKQYWQASNNEIKNIASSLKTPEEIYKYVVDTLEYDFSRVTSSANRLGAVGILNNKDSAVCLEFTDLFIALARAAGIPAREVDGYAFTENPRQRPLSLVQDILHAWPEYYDREKQTWVMIDPTWGNTTGGVDYFHILDFDHFTFVKKGVSSTYPVPAGGYKVTGEENRKDVFIWASIDESEKRNELELSTIISQRQSAGFPITGDVIVTNKGSKISLDEKVKITAVGLSPQTQIFNSGELLPYEKKIIPFTFDKLPFLTNNNYVITMSVTGKEYTKIVRVMPFFVENLRLIGGFIGVILSIIILIIAFKTRRIRVSK